MRGKITVNKEDLQIFAFDGRLYLEDLKTEKLYELVECEVSPDE